MANLPNQFTKSVGNIVEGALVKGVNSLFQSAGISAGSLISAISKNTFDVQNAFSTISSIGSLKLDSITAGGDTGFANGKCPERSAASDIAANRGVQGSAKSYKLNTDPVTTIGKNSDATSGKDDNVIHSLEWEHSTYYMALRFFEYDRTDLFKEGKDISKYTVILPLPAEFTDSTIVNYDTPDMGVIGTLQNELGFEKLRGAFGGNEASINELLQTGGGSGIQALLNAARDKGGNIKTLTTAVEQFGGIAPNPQPSIAFTGPQLREFTFTWTFNPRDKDESTKITNIIKKMKASTLPRKGFAESSGILRYPNMCKVNFYPWDGPNKGNDPKYGWGAETPIRMKRCMISNMIVNYAANGGAPAFFTGTNQPVFIQISLSLKEIEYFTSEDWEPYDGEYGIPENVNNAINILSGTTAGSFVSSILNTSGNTANQ